MLGWDHRNRVVAGYGKQSMMTRYASHMYLSEQRWDIVDLSQNMTAHIEIAADETLEDSRYAGLGCGRVGCAVLGHREDFAG